VYQQINQQFITVGFQKFLKFKIYKKKIFKIFTKIFQNFSETFQNLSKFFFL